MDSHAQIIVDFMAEHGITQVEMAQRLQVTAATLSRWLSGSHGISKKHRRSIEFICADAVLSEWMPKQYQEMVHDISVKLDKKLVKIDERLKELGYDSNGKLLPGK